MLRQFLPSLLALLLFATSMAHAQAPTWKAGVAKTVITPEQYMWMSGYAARTKPAEGKLHELWAKALVLEDPTGRRGVVLTLDLVGIDRTLSVALAKAISEKHRLPREAIIISTSHTHSGPVVKGNLDTMYFLSVEQQKLVVQYAERLQQTLPELVGKALANLAPARVEWGNGLATFATNRRNNKEAEVPALRLADKLRGPVDHDVPVLAVRDVGSGKLRATLFGYACHATVLDGYQWSGDYPGFAQDHLEKLYPESVALFWAGCGADQNPIPRRRTELADEYGRLLAERVADVLKRPMTPLTGELASAYTEIDLPFADLPTREQLLKDAALPEPKQKYVAARAKMLLKRMESQGSLRGTYPYPVQVWRLGTGPTLVTLGGEVVVDYALRLKDELGRDRTWVMGYANDVMAYIPSLRVLKEGGYEGGGAMVYYGQPTVWSTAVEERIVKAVHELVKRTRK